MNRLPVALLFSVTTLFTSSLSAQDFGVPANVTLKAKEDYARYEQEIIKAAKWLESKPVGQEEAKRIRVNGFVMEWITGSPSVTVVIQPIAGKLTEKNPHLLMLFMASYARWALENNYSTDELKGYRFAIKSVINNYHLDGVIKKNKTLQKAAEADKAGKLDQWVLENYNRK